MQMLQQFSELPDFNMCAVRWKSAVEPLQVVASRCITTFIKLQMILWNQKFILLDLILCSLDSIFLFSIKHWLLHTAHINPKCTIVWHGGMKVWGQANGPRPHGAPVGAVTVPLPCQVPRNNLCEVDQPRWGRDRPCLAPLNLLTGDHVNGLGSKLPVDPMFSES